MKKELQKCINEARDYMNSIPAPKLALVIDGKCLMYALDPTLRVMLLNLSLDCNSVVCCRVSPLQKAQVRSLVDFSRWHYFFRMKQDFNALLEIVKH